MALAKHGQEEKPCDITGCTAMAERSISKNKFADCSLPSTVTDSNVHLCKDHYREYKKQTKLSRDLDTYY